MMWKGASTGTAGAESRAPLLLCFCIPPPFLAGGLHPLSRGQEFWCQQDEIADDLSAFQQSIGFGRLQNRESLHDDWPDATFLQELEKFGPVFQKRAPVELIETRSIEFKRSAIRQQVQQNEPNQKTQQA